jgi:hypothetical protein
MNGCYWYKNGLTTPGLDATNANKSSSSSNPQPEPANGSTPTYEDTIAKSLTQEVISWFS